VNTLSTTSSQSHRVENRVNARRFLGLLLLELERERERERESGRGRGVRIGFDLIRVEGSRGLRGRERAKRIRGM